MFVAKDFALNRFVARYAHTLARICAMKQSRSKSFGTNIGPIPKTRAPTNFEPKRVNERLKPKLDVGKPENRVH